MVLKARNAKAGDVRGQAAALCCFCLPQLLITIVFFYWPAARRCGSRSCCRTPSGSPPNSSGSRTTSTCFRSRNITARHDDDGVFSIAGGGLSLSIALLLAVQADKHIKRRGSLQDAADLALCGGARRVAGVLWIFMFQPSLGVVAKASARWARLESAAERQSRDDPGRDGRDVEADFLQLPVLPRRLQSIPRAVIEAAAIDGASPMRRFWTIILPAALADRHSSCSSSTSSTCSSIPSASSTR
jgi:sn-glycerol 3-phosphate transport system permease protein